MSHASTTMPASTATLERFNGRPPAEENGVSPRWRAGGNCAGGGEPPRPDQEKRDAPADDQEVREPDLVELAVEPEPRDEDEGEQEKERGSDQESAQPIAHRITRSPARLRTARSRRAGCGRRCSGSRSASSRIERVAGTPFPRSAPGASG